MPGHSSAPPGEPPLPQAVHDLIVERIGSVAELEALLLLRNEPEGDWDPSAVARRLYVDEAAAAAALRTIGQRGLAAQKNERWVYAPETAALDDAVRALAQIYSQRLIAITTLIHGKTARAIHEFARAFVIRRKE